MFYNGTVNVFNSVPLQMGMVDPSSSEWKSLDICTKLRFKVISDLINTPLIDILKVLLEFKPNLEKLAGVTKGYKMTALMATIRRDQIDCMELLLPKLNRFWQTLELRLPRQKKRIGTHRSMLPLSLGNLDSWEKCSGYREYQSNIDSARGEIDLNVLNANGRTPLHMAAQYGHQ